MYANGGEKKTKKNPRKAPSSYLFRTLHLHIQSNTSFDSFEK